MRPDWKAGAGIAISVLLLWWVLRGVDVAEVWAGIRGADPLLFAASITVATAGFLVRALRWKVLLAPIREDTRLRSRFAAVTIGFMANNLLPARAGEFARAFALSKMEPIPPGGALGSLVVERFLDGLAILLLLGIAMAAPSFPSDVEVLGRPVGAAAGGAAMVLGAVLLPVLLFLLFPGATLRAVGAVASRFRGRWAEGAVGAVASFLGGLRALRDPRLLFPALLWSVGFWLWHSFSLWLGFRAFGIDAGYDAALFLNAVLAFFVAVPSSPGFFGTFHAGAMVGLSVYAVADETILSFAFGSHLGGFIPVTLIGLWYAGRLGLSLREVGAK